MKREELLRHLRQHGCELLCEGAKHSWWHHPSPNTRSAVHRHTEFTNHLVVWQERSAETKDTEALTGHNRSNSLWVRKGGDASSEITATQFLVSCGVPMIMSLLKDWTYVGKDDVVAIKTLRGQCDDVCQDVTVKIKKLGIGSDDPLRHLTISRRFTSSVPSGSDESPRSRESIHSVRRELMND